MESRCNEFEVASMMIEDSDIDVNGCSYMENNIEVPGDHDPDATEYSSSFGGTVSDSENCSGISEAEVESLFGREGCFSPSLEDFDAPEDVFMGWTEVVLLLVTFIVVLSYRKKKLTSHWRTFIRPLMWRCKWAELKMKEIETRASKYSRSLETVEQSKQWRTIQSPIGQCGSRSMPFSRQLHRKMLVKRRKRKRVENITDLTPYIMHHNLFSYLENRWPDPDGTILPDDVSLPDKKKNLNNELGNASIQSSFSIKECDMSLEEVLQKIELTQSRVQKIRGQLEMVISRNAAKFSSFENLNLLAPCEAQTSCAPSPTISANNGEIMSICALYPTAHRSTDFDIGDLVLPESVVSNFGEAIPGSDMIESTAGLLSAADVTLYQPLIGDSKEIVVENISISNEAAKGESPVVKCLQGKQLELDKDEQDESIDPSSFPASKPEPSTRGAISPQISTLNSCLASDIQFPKNKRSRGDRKLGLAGWTKMGSGEPDSQ